MKILFLLFWLKIIKCTKEKNFFTDYMNDHLDDIFWNTTIWELEVNLTKACGNKPNRILIRDYIKPGLDPKYGDYDLIHDGLKTGAVLKI